jgi:dihydrofolate reductase
VKLIHAEMARAAGTENIWIVGGGDLAGQFHDAQLLDEVLIQVASVTLGKGKPLFPRRVTNPAWKPSFHAASAENPPTSRLALAASSLCHPVPGG